MLATLVHQRPATACLVASNDKDLLPLLADRDVRMLNYHERGSARVITAEQAAADLGFPVQFLPEYLALCGDATDCIPGVEGIGAKTAALLVQQFQTVAHLYSNLWRVKHLGVRGAVQTHARLIKGELLARLSRVLVALDDEVPTLPAWKDLARQPCEDQALYGLLRGWEEGFGVRLVDVLVEPLSRGSEGL